jgi:hypothetical protein
LLLLSVVFPFYPCLGCLDRVEWIGPPLEASNRSPTYGGYSLQEGSLYQFVLGTPESVWTLTGPVEGISLTAGPGCVIEARGRIPDPSAGPPVRACLHPVRSSLGMPFPCGLLYLPGAESGVGLLVNRSRSLTGDWSGLPRSSSGGRRAVSWGRTPLACRLPPVPSVGPSCAASARSDQAEDPDVTSIDPRHAT